MKKQKIKVGIDFDGVLAYNPFRVVRAPVSYIKRRFFGVRKLKFYMPTNRFSRLMWTIVHESSILPAAGCDLIKVLAKSPEYEFHLVTARFHFLRPSLFRWLDRHDLRSVFTEIHLNMQDKQPHVHKLEQLEEHKLYYFIEDNWDIVEYIAPRTKTIVFWNYNITDRNIEYPYKIPYLQKALEEIVKREVNGIKSKKLR